MPEGDRKKELVGAVEDMIKNYENLPQHAMLVPITHYEVLSMLYLLRSILDCISES
jgi:hypothetical protein